MSKFFIVKVIIESSQNQKSLLHSVKIEALNSKLSQETMMFCTTDQQGFKLKLPAVTATFHNGTATPKLDLMYREHELPPPLHLAVETQRTFKQHAFYKFGSRIYQKSLKLNIKLFSGLCTRFIIRFTLLVYHTKL